VPALQKLCEHFLMTHASGRPIVALALAELHGNAELFREASRFVLDQATWDPAELEPVRADAAQALQAPHVVPRAPPQAR
jgi:hypothetical protein